MFDLGKFLFQRKMHALSDCMCFYKGQASIYCNLGIKSYNKKLMLIFRF